MGSTRAAGSSTPWYALHVRNRYLVAHPSMDHPHAACRPNQSSSRTASRLADLSSNARPFNVSSWAMWLNTTCHGNHGSCFLRLLPACHFGPADTRHPLLINSWPWRPWDAQQPCVSICSLSDFDISFHGGRRPHEQHYLLSTFILTAPFRCKPGRHRNGHEHLSFRFHRHMPRPPARHIQDPGPRFYPCWSLQFPRSSEPPGPHVYRQAHLPAISISDSGARQVKCVDRCCWTSRCGSRHGWVHSLPVGALQTHAICKQQSIHLLLLQQSKSRHNPLFQTAHGDCARPTRHLHIAG